jgi:ABC-type nitrate/sulfonate/bicarbonate transport system substrate-binding protein
MGNTMGRRLGRSARVVLSNVALLLLLCAAVLVDPARIGAQTPLRKVRIAYASSGINYADIFLAKEMGFYREEGLEPQLIQMSSSIAITAGISGELDGQASIGSAIRAIQRGAPLRVVAVTLRRPLYWLVVRPEYRSVKDLKGKVLGISTIGGSQHNRAKAMLALGGLDPDKDITSVQINDQTTQLQALVSNSVQVIALSPPWVAVARDKFKMNILDSALDKFAGIDSGLAVALKFLQEKPDQVKKMLRARTKGNRFFLENEREGSEFLSRLYRVDMKTGLESYRVSMPAFTRTSIPTDAEIKEHLANDAQMLKLAEPVHPSKIFDFGLQREINLELGVK